VDNVVKFVVKDGVNKRPSQNKFLPPSEIPDFYNRNGNPALQASKWLQNRRQTGNIVSASVRK